MLSNVGEGAAERRQ